MSIAAPQPQPPPGPPPPPGGGGPAPAPGGPGGGPPPQLVVAISQATGAPPQIVGAFLAYVVQQAGPNARAVLEQILRLPPPQMRQILMEFAQSPAGVQMGAGGGGLPPQAQVPPNGPPVGAPRDDGPRPMMMAGGPPNGPVPVGHAGGPPPGAPGGPVGAAPTPLRPRQPQQPKPKKDELKRKAPPSWEPAELPKSRFGKQGPTYAQVIGDANEGRAFFRDLTDALQEWRDIYHMQDEYERFDGRVIDAYQGDQPVTRAQPVTMANRIIGLTAPSMDRLGIQADPWADDDESREAAQAKENYVRYLIEELQRRYNRRATVGDFQPPFDRKLAGLATIEGGFAWRVMPDVDDPNFPWAVDVVPMLEIFARPRATTRQIECTLGEAYTYQEVRDLLPEPDEEADPIYNERTRVRLITWTDEVWWGMCLDFADPGIKQKVKERDGLEELWVYPPTEHKLGRRIFLVPNPWNATPLGPSTNDRTPRSRHLSQGIYAPLVPTIKMMNQIVGALRSGLFKSMNSPKKIKVDPAMRATYANLFSQSVQEMANASQMAGGAVVVGPNEDIADIVSSIAGSADGQALLQSLMGDLGDVAPPVLGGRGPAASGFDRFQASEAAGVLHVDPIISYVTGALEYLAETILTDVARFGDGNGKLFKDLPYRVYSVKQGSVKKGGYMSTLAAEDIKRCGPHVAITFKRNGLTERMQLAQLNMMLVKEHMKSRLSAMDELGIDDTEREQALMLAESVMEAPAVVKAMIRVALQQQAAQAAQEGDGDVNWSRVALDAFEEFQAQEAQKEQQAAGMPSPPGAPGGGPPPPMPGSSAPGLPPVMSGGD